MQRNGNRALAYLALIALLFSCSGASCFGLTREPAATSPIMFESTPQLDEVIQKVNQNTALIHQLQSDDVRITAVGAPSLRAKLDVEAPRKLRLRADFLMARELDIGSNDDVFWVFSKSGGGALLYARHEQFATSPAQRLLPVNPDWILDALGLVTLDPNDRHEGPYAHGEDEMEVRSTLASPSGQAVARRTIIHRTYGWVVEQQMYDASGRMLASAKAQQHRYYPEFSATLPEIIDIVIAPGQQNELAFQINVGSYRINQLNAPPPDLWVMPAMDGYPHLDLADPRSYQQFQPTSSQIHQPVYRSDAQSGYRPEYRGYTR